MVFLLKGISVETLVKSGLIKVHFYLSNYNFTRLTRKLAHKHFLTASTVAGSFMTIIKDEAHFKSLVHKYPDLILWDATAIILSKLFDIPIESLNKAIDRLLAGGYLAYTLFDRDIE